MLDIEVELVKNFGWSLKDIDETDIESLIPFVFRAAKSAGTPAGTQARMAYCDQVSWLG